MLPRSRDSRNLNVLLLRQLLADVFQCTPPRVPDRLVARTTLPGTIRTTSRTESEAGLVAQRLHRDRELDLLERQVAERNRPPGVELDIELFLIRDLDLLVLLGDRWTRAESYVK